SRQRHQIERQLRQKQEEAEWAERHKQVSDDELQKRREEAEAKLQSLKLDFPKWEIQIQSEAHREIRRLERERERLVLELARRTKLSPQSKEQGAKPTKPNELAVLRARLVDALSDVRLWLSCTDCDEERVYVLGMQERLDTLAR